MGLLSVGQMVPLMVAPLAGHWVALSAKMMVSQ